MKKLLLILCLWGSTLSMGVGGTEPFMGTGKFLEWQESIQRSEATDHTEQGAAWRKAQEKQMADRIMG